jgi:mRNA-degrading endonuclease RelE of RelBE toxin-antitoxin system
LPEYRLRFDRSFRQQLDTLPGDIRAIARRRISRLTVQPIPPEAVDLAGHPSYFRMWLPRGHRLVYRIVADDGVVVLLYLGPKTPDLYDRAGLGRQ